MIQGQCFTVTMSRTNRTNRYGKKHKEGQEMVYKCRCEHCVGRNNAVDKANLETVKEQKECLYCGEDVGMINTERHLNGWCVL